MSLNLIIFIYRIIRVTKWNPNRGGPYTDASDWIKDKKATINPISKDDNKCFQYVVTVALNHEKKSKTKIKPFIKKYNWEGINFLSEKDDCQQFEENNATIALNVLYAKKDVTQIGKKKLFF